MAHKKLPIYMSSAYDWLHFSSLELSSRQINLYCKICGKPTCSMFLQKCQQSARMKHIPGNCTHDLYSLSNFSLVDPILVFLLICIYFNIGDYFWFDCERWLSQHLHVNVTHNTNLRQFSASPCVATLLLQCPHENKMVCLFRSIEYCEHEYLTFW